MIVGGYYAKNQVAATAESQGKGGEEWKGTTEIKEGSRTRVIFLWFQKLWVSVVLIDGARWGNRTLTCVGSRYVQFILHYHSCRYRPSIKAVKNKLFRHGIVCLWRRKMARMSRGNHWNASICDFGLGPGCNRISDLKLSELWFKSVWDSQTKKCTPHVQAHAQYILDMFYTQVFSWRWQLALSSLSSNWVGTRVVPYKPARHLPSYFGLIVLHSNQVSPNPEWTRALIKSLFAIIIPPYRYKLHVQNPFETYKICKI